MKNFNEKEVANEIENVRTILGIEGLVLTEEDVAAGKRILSGETTAKEELAKIIQEP